MNFPVSIFQVCKCLPLPAYLSCVKHCRHGSRCFAAVAQARTLLRVAADVVALRCRGMLQGIEARKLYEMGQHIGTDNGVISCAVVANGRCGGTGLEHVHDYIMIT